MGKLEKIGDAKSLAVGLMDIALLTANANQLFGAFELCEPFKTILIVMVIISIVLQVLAACLLLAERLTVHKKEYAKCHIYNVVIGILVIIVIAVNVLATAFGHSKKCEMVEKFIGSY